MKTLEKLKAERDAILKEGSSLKWHDKATKKRLSTQVAFLNPLIACLEFNPTEQSLRDQLELAEKKLKSLHSQVDAEVGVSALPSVRQKWLAKNGSPAISDQIKNLKYILG